MSQRLCQGAMQSDCWLPFQQKRKGEGGGGEKHANTCGRPAESQRCPAPQSTVQRIILCTKPKFPGITAGRELHLTLSGEVGPHPDPPPPEFPDRRSMGLERWLQILF